MKYTAEELSELVSKLRQRLKRGLFASYITMEEAADCLESMHQHIQELEHQLAISKDRYSFVVQQWMAERLISDNLHADLISTMNAYNSSNDTKLHPTACMERYQQSRRNGTIAI